MAEGPTARSSGLHAPLPGPYGRAYGIRGRTVVELRGEVDIESAYPIGAYLDVVTAVRGHHVVIDLTRVAFFDCSGLAMLCRARRRTAENGGGMWVVCDRAAILRVFRADAVLPVFRTLPTLDDALAAEDW